jgi:hypothetical protein
MPVSVSVSSVDWVRNVVFTGAVTDKDLAAAYDAVARCLLDPSMDLLIDTTGVEQVPATTDGLRALASRRRQDALRAGVALPRVAVVAPDASAFGVGRMYEAIREAASAAGNYFVCRSIAEARQWLGRSDGASAALLLPAHA